jgi:uncharacterized membrane protein YbhN (UPF0104 family)
MNKTKLTLGNALRALRYMSFMIVTLGSLMVILTWGFTNVDEKTQLTTYLLMSTLLVLPHLIDIYDWLTKKSLI